MFYKASDIVNKARALANVTNSSFISANEDRQYLQSAWKNVYQKAINNGCKYWVKEVGIGSSGGFVLPDDFYQLCSIRNPYSGFIVPRKSESESDFSHTYEIKNNKLYIYGRSRPENLVLSYWPTPKELTFPVEEQTLKDLSSVIDYFDGWVVSEDGIYNISTGEQATVSFENTEAVYMGKHFIAIILIMEDVRHLILFNKKGEAVADVSDVKSVLRDENGIFYYITGDMLYRENGSQVMEIKDAEVTNLLGAICKNRVIYWNGTQWIDGVESGSCYAVNYNNRTAFINGDKLYFYEGGWRVLSLDTLKNAYRYYGIDSHGSFIEYNGTDFVLNDWTPDTLLDYPNNLLFEVLAYTLAKEYLLKMDADVSSILTGLGEASQQFFDSLSNDAGYYRIKNVY